MNGKIAVLAVLCCLFVAESVASPDFLLQRRESSDCVSKIDAVQTAVDGVDEKVVAMKAVLDEILTAVTVYEASQNAAKRGVDLDYALVQKLARNLMDTSEK